MKVVRAKRPEILDAIPRDRDAVIEASAGTGKTFTLEHLVVELLLEGVPIEQILVVTFTEQATAELRARIRERVEALLALERDEDVGAARPWILDELARTRLETALSSIDSAAIATLHGFCHRALGELAFDAGRLFSEAQVDSAEAFERAFLDALRAELAVNPAHREMLEAWLERRTLDNLHSLLAACARERGELRPAFDRPAFVAAARALPVEESFERAVADAVARTKMHGATRAALLRRIDAYFARARAWRGRDDFAHLLDQARDWLNENLSYLREKAAGIAQAAPLLDALSRLDASAPSFEAAVVQSFLPVVKSRLEERKRTSGELDFDDMLTLVRDALRGEGGAAFAQRLRERHSHALVDEFQDTDEVQWEIFRTLFHGQPGCRLYVIGDPKQAIYGFRGADVHTYLSAKRALRAAGGELVRLDVNFRATEQLIEAVNAILDPQATEPFFSREIRYDAPVRCGRRELQLTDGAGLPAHAVEIWHLHGRDALDGSAALHALAQRIASEVHAILRSGLRLGAARLEAGDIYVIAQKNFEQQLVGKALRESGLPVAFFKQDGLFQTAEAADVLDLLRAIADPSDRAAARKVWLTPFFGLDLRELASASEVPAEHPLASRLLSWRALAEARDHERLFASILDESGLARRLLMLAASERELTNYQHLFELLLEEVHRTHAPLDELARTLSRYIRGTASPPGAEPGVQRLESDRRAVQVMSLHKSKGLEAPVVFLFGGFGGSGSHGISTFHDGERRCAWVGPSKAVEAQVAIEAEEEHRRLMYVGLTRAKGRLYLPFVGELDPDEQAALAESCGGPQVSALAMAGPYRLLNARLQTMREDGMLTRGRGFVRELLRVVRHGEEPEPAPAPFTWTPDADLLAEVPPDARPEALRREHAGFFVTSYSRMAGARGEDEPARFKPEAHAPFVELGPDELARGAESGRFIHEVLERVALEPIAQADRIETWCGRSEVSELFEALARRHGIERRQLLSARRLVWNALRTPVELPRARLAGIAAAKHVLREVEFLYPIPERGHPLLGAAGGAFSIERGCIKGFIDVAFEHEGRVYFADWKTDVLGDYAPEALAPHVQAHYGIQERLYSLAMVRQLGIRDERAYEARFGGSLYLFVRGMEGSGRGVRAARPEWAELVSWEQALVHEQNWGISA